MQRVWKMKMKRKKVSIILFYDNNNNIILQDRKEMSKHGEEYGFFGGHSEGEESKEDTLKREIQEELNLDIKDLEDLRFFKQFHIKVPELNVEVDSNVFLAKIPKKIEKLKVDEGKIALMKFENSFNLNNLKMVPGDVEILREIYNELNKR
jgi:8-oxo-dGTP pyrophosphatase MutT (NUDIX family)